MTQKSGRISRRIAYVFAAFGALSLSACMSQGNPEGIGFREARFAEMSAIQTWRSCRDQAVALDQQARDEGSSARYLASARLIEKCEADVGPDAAKITSDERMRAYALGAQNYLKGGDLPKSRETLEKLRANFPGADLYYANGSSFIDTMEFLTGVRDRSQVGALGIANVDDDLKSELRRAQYWKRN
jgi:hypothetical protein